MMPTSNTEASLRRSERLPQTGRLDRRGAVVEDDFYNKLEKFNVQAGKKDKIPLVHVQRISKAHDTVMRSYYQEIHGSSGPDAKTSMKNIGEQMYV